MKFIISTSEDPPTHHQNDEEEPADLGLGTQATAISSLSVCRRKPVFVTCSPCENGTAVCVWNYKTRRNILTETFDHMEPTCADIHPSGYQLLVVFRYVTIDSCVRP